MKNHSTPLMQVQMPEVDPAIIPFITIVVFENKNQSNIFNELIKNLEEIESKRTLLVATKDSLIKKQKDLISSFNNIKFPAFPSPKYVWSKKKCQNLYVKYYKCLIDFYDENLKTVDLLIPFIKNCIDLSSPVKIEMDRFNKMTNVGQNEKVYKALSKYMKMNNYVANIESKGLDVTCRYGDIKRSQLWSRMKEIADYYEAQGPYEGSANKYRYYPPNEFDEMFMKFILVTKISDKFKICVQKMPKYGTYEDFKKSCINDSLQSVNPPASIDTQNNILKCSLKSIQINSDNFKNKDGININDDDDEKSSNDAKSDSDDENSSDNKNDNDDKSVNDNENNEKRVSFMEVHDVDDASSDNDENAEENNLNKGNMTKNKFSSRQNDFVFQRKKSVIEELQLQSLMDQEIDTENFRNFILSLFRLIKTNCPCSQAMLQLFHCSVIRILFDFYYVENSAVLYGRNLKDFYMEVCKEILDETPMQIEVSKKFFAPDEVNMQMREIIANDQFLQEGSSDLFLIQFLNNPLDMAIQVNRAFRIIQKSVDAKNDKDQPNNKVSSGMTSDDFINMLKPLYAINPYVCPSGICRFIELFCELFQLFDSLSYGLTTFSIVLKDVDEMSKNKEKALNNENLVESPQ